MHPLFYIAIFVPAVPCTLGLIRGRKLVMGQRWLVGLMAFYLINQTFGLVLSAWEVSNYPLFHLHVVVEFGFLSWIFFQAQIVRISRKFQLLMISIFALLGVSNAIWGDGIWTTPSIPLVIEAILLLAMVVMYFWKVYQESNILHIEGEFLFWLSLGILVFFAGTLLLSFFMKLIVSLDDQLFLEVFMIRNVLIILTNICYAIGMLCKAHPQKS